MSKYDPLSRHLQSVKDSKWLASFQDIEDVLGFTLPPSARRHISWWANLEKAHSRSWVQVGWRASRPSLLEEEVNFIKAASMTCLMGLRSVEIIPHAYNRDVERAVKIIARQLGTCPSRLAILHAS